MEYGEGFRRMMFARRKRKGMTQTELGAEVGISQHGISDYECGKTSIPIDDAAAIAAACSKVDECERALAYNVSPETCLDTLLFDVREVVHGSGRTD